MEHRLRQRALEEQLDSPAVVGDVQSHRVNIDDLQVWVDGCNARCRSALDDARKLLPELRLIAPVAVSEAMVMAVRAAEDDPAGDVFRAASELFVRACRGDLKLR